jgi:hypothetical protein
MASLVDDNLEPQLTISVVFQTDLPLAKRFADYIREAAQWGPLESVDEEQYVCNSGCGDDSSCLVFVTVLAERTNEFLSAVRRDPVIHRQASLYRRTFLITNRARKLPVMMSRVAPMLADFNGSGVRMVKIVPFPAATTAPLVEAELVKLDIACTTSAESLERARREEVAPDALLFCIKKKQKWHFGVAKVGWLKPEDVSSAPPPMCRAGYKMEECIGRRYLDGTHRVCVDIGAAPGGWSYALAMDPKMERRVFAIDPAELDTEYLKGAREGSIVHLRKKAEDAVADVLEALGGNREGVDCIVCDANLPPVEALERLIAPFRAVCRDNAVLILTCKCAKHGFLKKEVAAALEYLRVNWAKGGRVKGVHLIANTPNERTLVCEIEKRGGEAT